MFFSACAVTDRGPLHLKNQDCFALGDRCGVCCVPHTSMQAQGSVYQYVVCDGISSMPDSEQAADIACHALITPPDVPDLCDRLMEAMLLAERQVCRKRQGGTTAVALYSDGACAAVANVGDSRAYLFRDGELRQLTVDHNREKMIQELKIDKPAARRAGLDPAALTQYLGMGRENIQIEPACSGLIKLEEGDCFLLCTDGLTSVLTDTAIAAVLDGGRTIEEKAERLVRLALEAGTQDNVTTLLCECSVEEGKNE